MILDNRYLYEILTEGKYPERIPLDKLLTGEESASEKALAKSQKRKKRYLTGNKRGKNPYVSGI